MSMFDVVLHLLHSLSVLARRIELAKQTKPLKALVMSEHYLVPRQRLRMNIMPTAPVLPMLRELHRCGGSLAMLGIDQNRSSVVGRPQLMRFGVEVRARPPCRPMCFSPVD